jgi:hypothetical protein
MVPAAQLYIAQQKRRNRLRIERIGHFRNHQRAPLADQEVRAARVANLRISRSGWRRISVEGRSGQRQARCRRSTETHARCRERIAGSSARQVRRQKVWTAECRINEIGRVLADVEFVIEGDLADAKRRLPVEELLLKP